MKNTCKMKSGQSKRLRGDVYAQGSPRFVKGGFTLAEVLITLAVIGVIAALTLPTLVQSYLEKQRVTQLKTTVSKINQAIQRMEEEYGSLDTWGVPGTNQGLDENGNQILDYSGNQLFMTRLAKYFTGAKFLNNGDVIVNKATTLDGREFGTNPKKVLTEKQFLRLPDDSVIGVGWFQNYECSTKKMSRLGVDIFNFYLYPQKGLLPNNWNARVGNLAPKCSKFSSNIIASSADRICTAWVYYNENMDYLHCDDLNWQTKTKCK